MRLRDRLREAAQTFQAAPNLHTQLNTAEAQRRRAEQALEESEQECEKLCGELEEKDAQLRFLEARSDALLSALTEFSPKLSSAEELRRFYDAVSYDLDPSGFTLYRAAKELTGIEVTSLFPYEDARGMFEEASGYELMSYLTAVHFDAVEWEVIPKSTYERAELGEVDTSSPAYQQFERQLYGKVLERMGFDAFLAPTEPVLEPPAVQMIAQEEAASWGMDM